MEEITIRRAEESDFPALVELYSEFHEFHVKGVPAYLRMPRSADGLQKVHAALREIVADGNAILFVACLDGAVVGLAEAYLREVSGSPYVVERRYALLQSLAVRQGSRRQGIGQKLLQTVHGWAKASGVHQIEVETWEFPGDPVAFYLRMGYGTIKRRLAADL